MSYNVPAAGFTASAPGFGPVPVTNEEQLVEVLEDLDRDFDEPVPAVLACPGRRLSIVGVGTGAGPSVLSWVVQGEDTSLISNGGKGEGEPLGFIFDFSLSEFPPSAGIDKPTAFQGAREFFRTGTLPTATRWQEF